MKKFFIILIMFLATTISIFAETEIEILPSSIGLVKSVEYVDLDSDDVAQVKQFAEVQLLDGNNKNEIVYLDNVLTGNPFYDIKLSKNMKVILHVEESDGKLIYSIENIKRSNALVLLLFIFVALLLYVGKKKGLFSLISIVITCFLIFKVLAPLVLAGINPVFATVIICLLSTLITIYFVGGFNRKSTAAIIGCLLSIIFAGFLSYLTVKIAFLNGLTSEHSLFLFSAHPELNFISLIISTMLIATLGAVMDVGISVASTINEISEVDSTKTANDLFISGMNVGKDIIGTMANTLILVYLGTSLPLILLSTNIDLLKFINLNQVVTEISAALIGSIAIVICVPITAFVSSKLIKKVSNNYDFQNMKNNCK